MTKRSTKAAGATASVTVRSKGRLMSAVPAFLNIFCMVGLIGFHVYAEPEGEDVVGQNNSHSDSFVFESKLNLWDRITSGPDKLTSLDKILFLVVILLCMELLNYLVKNSGLWFRNKQIPVRGKHLDELTSRDQIFVAISKVQTAPFTYFYLRYCYHEPNILWNISDISIYNTILPLPLLYIVFDFFYTIIHWALHIKAIYSYVHKHHHHQKAPSRANVDAINVHPLEFFLGEYDHLVTIFLFCNTVKCKLHIIGALLFLVIGGVLAGLNHTRYDVVFSIFGIHIYDTKFHDVHHRIPQSNYGQYCMFWDYIFGTFRPYDGKDRINPAAQLDPKTGKSLQYMKSRNLQIMKED